MRIGAALPPFLAVAALATTGCATAPALYDLVVPNPVAHVRIERDRLGDHSFRWHARYGREPADIGHYPIHLHLDRDGVLEIPEGAEHCAIAAARAAGGEKGGTPGELDYAVGVLWLGDRAKAPAYGPPNDHSRATAPPSVACVVVLAPRADDLRRLVTYDLDGRVLHEQTLPRDVPIVDLRRWVGLLMAPVVDFVFTPVMLVSAAGYGVYAGGRWVVVGVYGLATADD